MTAFGKKLTFVLPYRNSVNWSDSTVPTLRLRALTERSLAAVVHTD